MHVIINQSIGQISLQIFISQMLCDILMNETRYLNVIIGQSREGNYTVKKPQLSIIEKDKLLVRQYDKGSSKIYR